MTVRNELKFENTLYSQNEIHIISSHEKRFKCSPKSLVHSDVKSPLNHFLTAFITLELDNFHQLEIALRITKESASCECARTEMEVKVRQRALGTTVLLSQLIEDDVILVTS